ncbi:hypothetical protein Z043_121805 [Scleropages formosus]|uniref:Pyrroline-5-carboxylate reductase catalytic N-terminal domain-containing protein n=1 Tax=Scleropages formosus TaxID=113540 RepID=A0A0P7WGJ8_SCLFO|nr:hypothetical protein Z043_121805 [Scleropages formosus]
MRRQWFRDRLRTTATLTPKVLRDRCGHDMETNSLAMSPVDGGTGRKPTTVCIFGTGDFGRSLGLRLLQAGYAVVIFLAVHRENYDFLGTLSEELVGKVLVDVSNNPRLNQYPESNAEYLGKLVPGASVVKAFNTVSAWALQSGGLDANRQVMIYSAIRRGLWSHPLQKAPLKDRPSGCIPAG